MKPRAITLAATLAAAAAWAAPAFAHAHLEATTLADGAVVAAAPEEISLTFNEPVALAGVSLETADGDEIPMNFMPSRDEAAMHTLQLPELAEGAYSFSCRALGDDGHVMTETIHFTVSESMPADAGHMHSDAADSAEGHMHADDDAGHMHSDEDAGHMHSEDGHGGDGAR